MGGIGGRFFAALTAIAAVATVPLGLLAGIFGSWPMAAVVFVVGWLLLVPVFAILSGDIWMSSPGHVERWMDVAERAQTLDESADERVDDDPFDVLRRRYATGEIDEAEFEERVEKLLALDLLPPEAASVLADSEELRDEDASKEPDERAPE